MTSSVCRYRNSRPVTYFLQWDHVKSNSLCRSDIMERWRVWLIACCYSDRSHAQYLRKDGSPWGRLNIRMSSYQYRDSHYKDKTVSRPSYLYNGNTISGKTTSFYWKGVLVSCEVIRVALVALCTYLIVFHTPHNNAPNMVFKIYSCTQILSNWNCILVE